MYTFLVIKLFVFPNLRQSLKSFAVVISVARQCVWCCKGDEGNQWEMAILGVSELCNP